MQDNLPHYAQDFLYDDAMEINEWVMLARKRAKLTQDQVAEHLGVTRGNVSAWENGRHEPSISQLRKLSALTGYDVAPLFGGQESQREAHWPFKTDIGQYQQMPNQEKEKVEDFVEFVVDKWHSSQLVKSKKSA